MNIMLERKKHFLAKLDPRLQIEILLYSARERNQYTDVSWEITQIKKLLESIELDKADVEFYKGEIEFLHKNGHYAAYSNCYRSLIDVYHHINIEETLAEFINHYYKTNGDNNRIPFVIEDLLSLFILNSLARRHCSISVFINKMRNSTGFNPYLAVSSLLKIFSFPKLNELLINSIVTDKKVKSELMKLI